MTKQELLQIAKPMPFNTEMVRAILNDLKAVTRRKVKQDTKAVLSSAARLSLPDVPDNVFIEKLCLAPCEVGDILYVQETFCKHPKQLGRYYFRANSICDGKSDVFGCPEPYDRTENCDLCEWLDGWIKWRPLKQMPKEAARIFLRVTGVRVERLQDIDDVQLQKEGIPLSIISASGTMVMSAFEYLGAYKIFSYLWDSTIKKTDLNKYSWQTNPWVWVIEFERVEI